MLDRQLRATVLPEKRIRTSPLVPSGTATRRANWVLVAIADLKGVDEGFCVRDVKVRPISRKWAEVQVAKCGWVRFRLTRPLGAHGMARVRKDRAGRWHISFAALQPAVCRCATGATVGVDLGVAHTISTSDGHQ